MSTEIRVPTLGESVSEATIGRWFKQAGEAVRADEPVVELETDKVTLEVNAPAAGVLAEIAAKSGDTVAPGALLGQIEAGVAGKSGGVAPSAKATPPAPTPAPRPVAAPPRPAATGVSAASGGAAVLAPTLGESVSEATVGRWFKRAGETVNVDEPLVELETDKVTLEINAPAAGVLSEIAVETGGTVAAGAVLGRIAADARPSASADVAADTRPAEPARRAGGGEASGEKQGTTAMPPAPSAAKLAAEHAIDTATIEGSGRRGQVIKGDVLAAIGKLNPAQPGAGEAEAPAMAPVARPPSPLAPPGRAPSPPADAAREERVRMSKLRQTIARRLKDAQNTAAMLTTFNEVDMTGVMTLRTRYKDLFEKKHGAKLGFMGLFVKACVGALRDVPAVNAEIDGADLVYKNFYHIGIAVGTDKGLVVPVLRDADHMSLAGIEKAIAGFGKRARDGQIKLEEMQGGTFTITNGGIYGSLMSTPILNPPQCGILGMHKIQERPVAVGGKVEVRPMMYLALSYDHRVVDGREAVTFLVRVKDALEDPARLMLEV